MAPLVSSLTLKFFDYSKAILSEYFIFEYFLSVSFMILNKQMQENTFEK